MQNGLNTALSQAHVLVKSHNLKREFAKKILVLEVVVETVIYFSTNAK